MMQWNEKGNRKGRFEKGEGKETTEIYKGGDTGKCEGGGQGGFKGPCHMCGKQGHRTAEYRTATKIGVESPSEDQGGREVIESLEQTRGDRRDDEVEVPVMAVVPVEMTREHH